MFSIGPTPDQATIEDRPDTVSVEAALVAWHAGYSDAKHDEEFHWFEEDSADLQEIYANGYERGLRDHKHVESVNGRHGTRSEALESREKVVPEPDLRERALRIFGGFRKWTEENPGVANAAAILVLAGAVLRAGRG